jgi:hypothetical protein
MIQITLSLYQKIIGLLLAVVISLMITGCSGSSVVTSSWKDPVALVKTDSLKKVMIGVLSFSEFTRRKAEERVSRYHNSFVPSYQVLVTKEILTRYRKE